MTVKVIYSNSYRAKQARIRRLPKDTEKAITGAIKKDLLNIKKLFHDGIAFNRFRLEKLADMTIESKRKKGYSKPKTPLYGKGDDAGDRSYSNMLNIVKLKDGWKLVPSKRMHHSGKISLEDLFKLHEHGAIIKKKKKNGETILILIPPRPALLLAYRKWLTQKKKNRKETSKDVKQMMQELISKGTSKKKKILESFNERITLE